MSRQGGRCGVPSVAFLGMGAVDVAVSKLGIEANQIKVVGVIGIQGTRLGF